MMINMNNNQFTPRGPSSMVFPSAKDLEPQYTTEKKKKQFREISEKSSSVENKENLKLQVHCTK